MPERRHISDSTWLESQKLLAGKQTTERVKTARERAVVWATEAKENITYGLLVGAGAPIGSVVLNFYDKGPEWLQKSSLVFGVLMALGSVLQVRENQQKADDWQEILDREIANSRIAIAREDLTLTRTIYEAELRFTTDDEVLQIKQVLNYLRDNNLLIDQQDILPDRE